LGIDIKPCDVEGGKFVEVFRLGVNWWIEQLYALLVDLM
jgi:hypothetical protein